MGVSLKRDTALGLLSAAHVTDATPEPRRLLLAG
jgi:hypothetical protein